MKKEKLLIIILVIVLLIMGFYIILNKPKSNKNNNLCTSEASKTMTKEEALNIVNKLYIDVYHQLGEGRKNFAELSEEKYNFDGIDYYMINIDALRKYFTGNAIKNIVTYFKNEHGRYFDYYPSDKHDDFFTRLTSSTNVFGQTDQGVRQLRMIDYTDTMIVVVGVLENEDHCPRHIIFLKENDVWRIEDFDISLAY